MALGSGEIIDGKYRILRILGEGGMGAVYEGENLRIHRRVAIKVLHTHVAKNELAVGRFEREAQAAGRIGSEHIVEVLDLGMLEGGDRYMVMEYLEGETLSARLIARGRLAPHELLPVVIQILDGLAAAHEAGIIHRDLKPDNVFLVQSRKQPDFVKLVDFGISKFSALDSEFSMTRTGAVMGTPYYMSPEQAQGKKSIDHRVDIYALGVMLYEAVSGRVPFQGETFNELMFNIALTQPPPLPEVVPGIDPVFAGFIARAMARDPNERFATVREFAHALNGWAQSMGVPTSVRRPLMDQSAMFHPTAGTGGAWASTGDVPGVPKRSGRGLAIGLALVALIGVVVVLAGVVAFQFRKSSTDASMAAARAEQEKERTRVEAKGKEQALREAQAEAESARREREELAAEARRRQEEAERVAAETAKAAEEQAKATATARPTPPVKRASTASGAGAKTSAPSTSAKAGGATVSGRKIRTSL
jgi:serine/threonine-protein kinase